MARYNEIQVGRFNRLIQKLLSLKGPASLVSAEDSLGFVLPLFHGVENRYLEAWERFGAVAVVTAQGVATKGEVMIRNTTRNVVAVFERLAIFQPGATDVFFLQFNSPVGAALANAVVPNSLDTRTRATPSIDITFGAAGIGGANISGGVVPVNALGLELVFQENQELPLLPNSNYLIIPDTLTNSAFRVALLWRERQLEESERA